MEPGKSRYSPLVSSLQEAEAAGLRIQVHVTRRWPLFDRSPRVTAAAWGRKFGLDFSRENTVLIYLNQRSRRFSILYTPDWEKKTGPRYWIEYAEALRSDLLSTQWERALALAVRTLMVTHSASGRGVNCGIGNATPG